MKYSGNVADVPFSSVWLLLSHQGPFPGVLGMLHLVALAQERARDSLFRGISTRPSRIFFWINNHLHIPSPSWGSARAVLVWKATTSLQVALPLKLLRPLLFPTRLSKGLTLIWPLFHSFLGVFKFRESDRGKRREGHVGISPLFREYDSVINVAMHDLLF